MEEFTDDFPSIEIGVPQQSSAQISAQLGELTTAFLWAAIALTENAGYTGTREMRNIFANHIKIGKRQEVVSEVGEIIPDKDFGRNLAPALQVLYERTIKLALRQRMSIAGGCHVAKTNDHVA